MTEARPNRTVDILREEIAIITGQSEKAVELDKSIAENGINSLGFVELLLAVERRFQLRLMENAMSNADISSVSALAAKIENIIDKTDQTPGAARSYTL